jgi:lysozyme family protein
MTIGEQITELLKKEGGYSNDKADSGGETNFGISKKAYPDLDIKNLTEAQARAIYEQDYSIKPGINKLPKIIQPFLFDYAVNSGPIIAIKALQRAIGVNPDGVVGPKTIDRINTYNDAALTRLLNTLITARCRMICNLVQRRPKDVKFLEGWVMRVLSFLP